MKYVVAAGEEAGAPAPGMVRGPYLAESYPVSVEGKYLVVDIAVGRGAANPVAS